jgi:nicotinamidase-related amidase
MRTEELIPAVALIAGMFLSLAQVSPVRSESPVKSQSSEEVNWTLRFQVPVEPAGGADAADFQRQERTEVWKADRTAIIVCDVWDYHHCLNAVRRLDEFLPRLNEFIKDARRRGMIIIHSPSDCMAAYEKHPARLRAIQTRRAVEVPPAVEEWCSRIPAEESAVYPIDQSDGGEDDDPAEHAEWAARLKSLGRNPAMPWKAQSDKIEIDSERDYVSDRGDEVWNILADRGIQNVVLTGVHTNMCVLGRPFGLRQMVRNGKNVALVRDLTDCMYNPRRWPYVDHFTGNDLVISHVERYVCPTVTSDQLLGGSSFRFSEDRRAQTNVTDVPTPPLSAETLSTQWSLISLPGSWSAIPGISKPPECATSTWYRCSLRLSDQWMSGEKPSLLVQPPKKGTLNVWINGTKLSGIEPGCLACSEPEPVRFALKPDAVTINDANHLVIQVLMEAAEDPLLPPPVLKSGDDMMSLAGRWQIRVGTDNSWSNIPLPAKFGTSTDIVYEPTVGMALPAR